MSLTEYAVGGEQIADTHSPATAPAPTFEVLPTGSITPSRTNPRKTFDAGKLQELADSIKASGVHQPILVRPLPASRMEDTFLDRRAGMPLPSWELIAGERRLRACRLAGVDEIPAMIKHLTDAQVLECQIVENLQRDDLAPLEEAEGYQALIDATGLNKDEIGGRIGRSRTYVYGRLKLLDLCQEARTAMREGKIDASKGLLIARIPNHTLQLRALNVLAKPDYNGDPMSQRSALRWIRDNVMLRLEDATFDVNDKRLVPDAGTCAACPKRTGADPDLFSDVDAPDLCTDKICFDAKGEAHRARIVAQAKARGLQVIDGKEALELMPHAYIRNLEGYERADAKVDHGTGTVPLRELMTAAERLQIKLLVDPHGGEPMEIITDELATKLQARAKPAEEDDGDESSMQALERQIKHAASQLAAAHARHWRAMALDDLRRAVTVDRKLTEFSAAVLRALLWRIDDGESEESVDAIPDIDLGPRLVMAALEMEASCCSEFDFQTSTSVVTKTPCIDATAATLGLDLQRYRDTASADLRGDFEELESQRAALKQRVKVSQKDAPGAAAEPKSAKAKRPGGNRRMAVPKTTAEEATAGIAAGLQALDDRKAGKP